MAVLSGVTVEVLLCLFGDVVGVCVLVFGCHVCFLLFALELVLSLQLFLFGWVGIYK